MRNLRLLPQALKDMREIKAYIARDRPSAASRVLNAIMETVLFLSRNPMSGRLVDSPHPGPKGLRVLPVIKFEIYLVFYRPPDGKGPTTIVRVLHGARDVFTVMEEMGDERAGE